MKNRNVIIILLFIAAVLIGNRIGNLYFNVEPATTPSYNSVASVLASQSETLELRIRTKDAGCKVSGPLPDPACTPGAVFPNAAPQEICVTGYTKTVRNVPASLKRKVYAEYGISYPQPTGSYEADHLIPLELGGSNDISNLFPEAASPSPGFKEKDLVENFLHNEVCAGRADLIRAQEQIVKNWLAVWNSLTPGEMKSLREQF